MKHSLAPPLLTALLAAWTQTPAEVVRPTRFGPVLEQGVILEASPAGWRYLPPFASYTFQASWIEPIGSMSGGIFRGSYLETQCHLTLSPYQGDVGTTFNLRPMRFFEIGLSYNRLVFPNTLVGFNPNTNAWPDSVGLPDTEKWGARAILMDGSREPAGADIFTFQANATFQLGRVQVHGGGFRNLWDVDVQDREVLYEYSSSLLIKKRDRINSLYAQAFLNLEPYLDGLGFTLRGFTVREQYWWTTQTGMSQNQISGGFSGLRWGRNTDNRYRGLDGMIGYWTDHAQVNEKDVWQRLRINFQWVWNIQVLRFGEAR